MKKYSIIFLAIIVLLAIIVVGNRKEESITLDDKTDNTVETFTRESFINHCTSNNYNDREECGCIYDGWINEYGSELTLTEDNYDKYTEQMFDIALVCLDIEWE